MTTPKTNTDRKTAARIKTVSGLALGLAVGLGGALTAGATGCASNPSGAQRMDSTVSSIASVESLIQDGQIQLGELMAAIDGLEEAEDIDAQFRTYQRELRALDRIAERVRAERVSLQTQAAAHATQWRAEAQSLTGDQAQEISQNRRRDFERAVNEVSESLDALRAEYDPFLDRAKDLRVLLENDLTGRGIQATRPVRRTVSNLASELRLQSEETLGAIADARQEFSR
ncbi:MAG: hypothetical protein WBA67_11345 [Jannaschia sp.]